MARNCYRNHIFFQLFGCLTCLTITSVRADGRVFLLESGNVTDVGNERLAKGTCSSQGARLASADELRHAVTECSFSVCARGWLAGPSIGTIVCTNVGGGQKGMKVMDVIVENATAVSRHLDVFCIKDKDDPCGDPPSFPHTTLQGHTGFEMGDELLYTCIPGYVMPNGRTAFSLLCDSCGVWYGLVQLCIKDETEAHIDYEDKFPDETHVFKDPEEDEEGDPEGAHFSNGAHDGVELEHAVHRGVEQEGVAHEDLDYEGMEQDRADHEAADYGVVQESEPDKDLDYEGVEQKSVAVEGLDHEGEQQQDVTHEGIGQEGVEQELGDRPEEVSMTENEAQQEGGVEGNRDMVEDEVEEVEDSTDRGDQQPTTVTDAPVSLLSQKHLFWFPSDTFHEEEAPEDTDEPAAAETDSVPAEGDNHIGLKPSESDTGGVTVPQELDDFDVGLPTGQPQNGTRGEAGETITTSDESWLDGYPITQEAEEDGDEGEKIGSTGAGEEEQEDEEEEEVDPVTDSPNHVEISQPDASSSVPSDDVTQIVASPTRPVDYGIKHKPAALTPTSPPENVSSSAEDVEPELTTAPSAVEQTEATTTATDGAVAPDFAILDRDAAVAPTAPWETTASLYPFLDHLPGPTDQEDVTVPYQDHQESATESPDEFPGTSLHDERMESNLTQEGTGAKLLPTGEPCLGDACPSGVGRGPVIAIIIVAICALIMATALAVWCYKKRQQKSSVYKMNGKGQIRHPQQMEMQQKV
ncbi:sushi domain-containing protein 5 [Anguilla anguilla]|uniref:sushi domain-containing protein 5 n=1 Tax=Anguilla anguilla TaxID=7936 RepID=UPI0015AD3468|nr:sushi domain-containing protein 5 [Anguilla anguilla]